MCLPSVGGADRLLTETVVLVVRPRESRGQYEPMIPDEWDVRTATPGESVRSLFPRIDLICLTDRALVGRTRDQVAERAARADGEPVFGIVTGGDGFGEVSPDVSVDSSVGDDEFQARLRTLRIRSAYDDAIREYYSLVDCIAAMETNRSTSALQEDPVYERVQSARTAQHDRVEGLRDRLLERGADVAFAPVDIAPDSGQPRSAPGSVPERTD